MYDFQLQKQNMVSGLKTTRYQINKSINTGLPPGCWTPVAAEGEKRQTHELSNILYLIQMSQKAINQPT